jgi:hypothetical protein
MLPKKRVETQTKESIMCCENCCQFVDLIIVVIIKETVECEWVCYEDQHHKYEQSFNIHTGVEICVSEAERLGYKPYPPPDQYPTEDGHYYYYR